VASFDATNRAELAAYSPLAVDALKAAARFKDAAFRESLGLFYPTFTRMIESEHSPAEVSRTLSDVFAKRVGPLVLAAL